jgi:hypothetical protein
MGLLQELLAGRGRGDVLLTEDALRAEGLPELVS